MYRYGANQMLCQPMSIFFQQVIAHVIVANDKISDELSWVYQPGWKPTIEKNSQFQGLRKPTVNDSKKRLHGKEYLDRYSEIQSIIYKPYLKIMMKFLGPIIIYAYWWKFLFFVTTGTLTYMWIKKQRRFTSNKSLLQDRCYVFCTK